MRDWLVAKGSFISPKVEVDINDELGYGLKAIEVIQKGEEICQIPQDLYLMSQGEHALHDLAVKLCLETLKGQDSPFISFMNTLPSDLSYLPTYWHANHIHSIEGTALSRDIQRMKSEWKQSFVSMTASHPGISQDLYLWARATIQGRAWCLTSASSFSDGCDKTTALIPFVSLCNHSDRKFSSISLGNGITCPATSVSIRAESKYYPSEAIDLNYGELSFQQRILCFGWVDRTIHTNSFAITPITFEHFGQRLSYEVKSMMHQHTAVPCEFDLKTERRELKLFLGEISELCNSTTQDSAKKLVSVLNEELVALKSNVDVEHCDFEFNGYYYFHNESMLESDTDYVKRVEVNALLSLIYAMRTLLD